MRFFLKRHSAELKGPRLLELSCFNMPQSVASVSIVFDMRITNKGYRALQSFLSLWVLICPDALRAYCKEQQCMISVQNVRAASNPILEQCMFLCSTSSFAKIVECARQERSFA